MRPLLGLLLALAAWGEEPAPATTTATQGTGPTAGERTTSVSLAVDEAWARARAQAQNEQRLRRAQAAGQTSTAQATQGVLPVAPSIEPGGLATLVEGDEVALLLELQRRRRNAGRATGDARGDVLAAELAVASTTPTALPALPLAPGQPGAVAHPSDEPHPGPAAPAPANLPERPDRLPAP